MDRAEATGFGIAVTGHVALFAALALGLASAAVQPPAPPPAMEVSFAEDVGLVSTAPQATIEPPPQSVAPELGPPEEAPPAPLPEPAPPQPLPEPRTAPPEPTPKQAAPTPTPARERPAPKQKAAPAPARPKAAPAQPSADSGQRSRGSRIGADLLKGLGPDPSPAREVRPAAATMSSRAAADIGSAIARQVQPCADRQVYPGPGAERIVTTINLRLNRDGSLAQRPSVGRQTGIDDENRRYADRVADLAVRSFVECAPLRGLPVELYDVPNGWRNFTLRYKLPE